MDETCWDKVEDAIKAVLDPLTAASAVLDGWTVKTGQSAVVAVEDGEVPVILIWTTSIVTEQSDEQHQTLHTMTLELEAVSKGGPSGTLNRQNKSALAYCHSAIAADRTVGGRLQDIQEVDIAPARIEGKDTNGASLQYQTQFFTPRDDWLTIVGAGGTEF